MNCSVDLYTDLRLQQFSTNSTGPEALSKLIEEARIMSSDIEQATFRHERLANDTRNIQRDLDDGLKPLLSSAIDGMNTIGGSIVDLYNIRDQNSTSATSLVAICKGQGQVVARRFNNLHESGQDILRRAGDVSGNNPPGRSGPNRDVLTCQVAIEVTNAACIAEKQLKRIGEMVKISSAMRVDAEKVKQLREYANRPFISPLRTNLNHSEIASKRLTALFKTHIVRKEKRSRGGRIMKPSGFVLTTNTVSLVDLLTAHPHRLSVISLPSVWVNSEIGVASTQPSTTRTGSSRLVRTTRVLARMLSSRRKRIFTGSRVNFQTISPSAIV